MKITITNYEKDYTFFLNSVAQLFGQNMSKKNYIFESLRRYFGTYKYSEEKNPWRDNVLIDDNSVGRKYYSVLSINSNQDLISLIGISKQSITTQYIKNVINQYECQAYIEQIDNALGSIFKQINDDIYSAGNIQLDYSLVDLFDMVQNTTVYSSESKPIAECESYELFVAFLDLLLKLNEVIPQSRLILVENIDHMVSRDEYPCIISKMKKIADRSDIRFICSCSLDGYWYGEKDMIEEIAVFNDVDFCFPDINHMINAIINEYPIYECDIDIEWLCILLGEIVNKVGRDNYLTSLEGNVICKIINKSLLINQRIDGGKEILWNYLKN